MYNHNAKIVGGIEAVDGSWPAHVLVLQTTIMASRVIENSEVTTQKSFFCGYMN